MEGLQAWPVIGLEFVLAIMMAGVLVMMALKIGSHLVRVFRDKEKFRFFPESRPKDEITYTVPALFFRYCDHRDRRHKAWKLGLEWLTLFLCSLGVFTSIQGWFRVATVVIFSTVAILVNVVIRRSQRNSDGTVTFYTWGIKTPLRRGILPFSEYAKVLFRTVVFENVTLQVVTFIPKRLSFRSLVEFGFHSNTDLQTLLKILEQAEIPVEKGA